MSRPSRSVARDGLDRGPPGEQLAGRPRAFGGEPFVGRGRDAGRTIDDVELQLIEIGDLVHRLGDREAKDAVDWAGAVRP